MVDEDAANERFDLVEKHQVLMIKARVAGAGKSANCKHKGRLQGYDIRSYSKCLATSRDWIDVETIAVYK